MTSFTFVPMPKLIVGPGVSSEVGKHASVLGRCVLLVTGAASLEKSGHFQRLVQNFNNSSLRLFHCPISGEPSPEVIDAAVNDAADKNIDVVVAAGGGSVLDAGKAIAAMLKEQGPVADYLEGVGSKKPSGKTLPVVALPTTSGTGSEATKNAVITRLEDAGFKKSLRHDNYVPKIAILDAELCISAPPSVTAACGMDALTQLIESYISTSASPLTDALSLNGLEHLIPALPDACGQGSGDPVCRGAVAYGAFLSGVTLANAGLGSIHGIAGPMGGLIPVPHGIACANLLPAVVSATLDNLKFSDTEPSRTTIEKLAYIGRLFGSSHKEALDSSEYLVEMLYEWLEKLAVPRFASFGLTPDRVPSLVEMASNKNNPLPLSPDQMRVAIMDRF